LELDVARSGRVIDETKKIRDAGGEFARLFAPAHGRGEACARRVSMMPKKKRTGVEAAIQGKPGKLGKTFKEPDYVRQGRGRKAECM